MQLPHSLGLRQNLTLVLSTCKADEILVLGTQWTQQISKSVFPISSPLDQGKANHWVYSNPGTQVGAQNKDFGAVLQTALTRVKFHLWRRFTSLQILKSYLYSCTSIYLLVSDLKMSYDWAMPTNHDSGKVKFLNIFQTSNPIIFIGWYAQGGDGGGVWGLGDTTCTV